MRLLLAGFGVVLLTTVFSLLAATVGGDAGPGGILSVAALGSAGLALMGYLTRYDKIDLSIGLISAVAILVIAATVTVPQRRQAATERALYAPQVVELASTKFDALDANKDGLITADELTAALHSASFTLGELEVIAHMRAQLPLVGHLTQSKLNPLFAEGAPPIDEYAIGKVDVSRYLQRVREKDRHWQSSAE